MNEIKPPNRKKDENLPRLPVVCSSAKVKKQIATEAHQNKTPKLESAPIKGLSPVVAEGSRVKLAMGMLS